MARPQQLPVQASARHPHRAVLVRRDQAKGATFFSAVEGETVRPMLDVSWAPFLGAFSVLFEEFHEGKVRALQKHVKMFHSH